MGRPCDATQLQQYGIKRGRTIGEWGREKAAAAGSAGWQSRAEVLCSSQARGSERTPTCRRLLDHAARRVLTAKRVPTLLIARGPGGLAADLSSM